MNIRVLEGLDEVEEIPLERCPRRARSSGRAYAGLDLAQFAYNGDSSRMQNDLANLNRQGLMKQTSIMDSDLSPVRAVTLTKEGHWALSYNRFLRPNQASYHGVHVAYLLSLGYNVGTFLH